jgi:hypothetical protein
MRSVCPHFGDQIYSTPLAVPSLVEILLLAEILDQEMGMGWQVLDGLDQRRDIVSACP